MPLVLRLRAHLHTHKIYWYKCLMGTAADTDRCSRRGAAQGRHARRMSRSARRGARIAATLLLLAAVVNPAGGATFGAPDLATLIAESSYPIRFEQGRWRGPGGDLLLAAAADARFVGLAEPHNVREIPALTGGLLAQLRERYGFEYLALEQGAAIVARACTATRERGPAAVAEVAASYPRSFHFSTDQELRLIGQLCADKGAEPVWGLDREVAVTHVLEELEALAATAADRAWLQSLARRAERAAADDDYAAEVAILEPGVLERLADVFAQDAAAGALLELARTFREYGSWQLRASESAAAGYRANLIRERWMKRAFASYYGRALSRDRDALPRVMVRAGHWHLSRGFGPSGVLTLGNFLVELANLEGLDALLINIQVVNEPGRFWTITDYPEYRALFGVADPSRSVLVDLRPLRPAIRERGLTGLTPALRDMIDGFDAVLLLAGASRGTWEWRLEGVPGAERWTGTLELPGGEVLALEIRGDVSEGRPLPVAAQLPDGSIVRFAQARYEAGDLLLVAAPGGGMTLECRLHPTDQGYGGECRGPEMSAYLSIDTGPGAPAP